MTKTFILAIAIVGMTACTKEEITGPSSSTSMRPAPTLIADSLDYTLDFDCPSENVHLKGLHPYSVLSNLNNNNVVIGKIFFYRYNGFTFTVIYRWDGTHSLGFISGIINGHTFIDYNNYLNICGGFQQVPYSYVLRNGFGKIVDSNVTS